MRAGGAVGASLAGWVLDAERFPERAHRDLAVDVFAGKIGRDPVTET